MEGRTIDSSQNPWGKRVLDYWAAHPQILLLQLLKVYMGVNRGNHQDFGGKGFLDWRRGSVLALPLIFSPCSSSFCQNTMTNGGMWGEQEWGSYVRGAVKHFQKGPTVGRAFATNKWNKGQSNGLTSWAVRQTGKSHPFTQTCSAAHADSPRDAGHRSHWSCLGPISI